MRYGSDAEGQGRNPQDTGRVQRSRDEKEVKRLSGS